MIQEYRIEIIGSLVLHLFLMGILASSSSCVGKSSPQEQIIIVKAVSIATIKRSKLPTRASKAPRELASQPNKPKEKAPTPPEMKTTPDQMVIKKEEKKPEPKKKENPKEQVKKSEPQNNKQSREEIMRSLAKKEALESLKNAPDGPVDREASSQEGTAEKTSGSGVIGPSDPILSAYVEASRNAIIPNWAPLPALIAAHPEYEVVLKVEVSEDGTMRNPQIIKKSGDSSFDRAAIMAIHKTIKIPPPPEKWKASAKSGIVITLSAQDK
jgi:TonB family protein